MGQLQVCKQDTLAGHESGFVTTKYKKRHNKENIAQNHLLVYSGSVPPSLDVCHGVAL